MYKLIDFYSNSCGPCKLMDPIVSAIISQVEGVELEKVNIGTRPDLAQLKGVTLVPTFILLNAEGVEVSRKIGTVPAPTLRDWIKKHVP